MKVKEGAESNWTSFRSATFLMLTNRGQRPVQQLGICNRIENNWLMVPDSGRVVIAKKHHSHFFLMHSKDGVAIPL